MGVVVSYLTKNLNQSPPVYYPIMVALTPEQVEIVQETWKIPAKNATDAGEAILLKFFEKYPHNQNKFQAFKNTPLLTLKVSCFFFFFFITQRLNYPLWCIYREHLVSVHMHPG